jgi:hypothetical protein
MDDFSVHGDSFDKSLKNLEKVLIRCIETVNFFRPQPNFSLADFSAKFKCQTQFQHCFSICYNIVSSYVTAVFQHMSQHCFSICYSGVSAYVTTLFQQIKT